jgi:hypothetical protein
MFASSIGGLHPGNLPPYQCCTTSHAKTVPTTIQATHQKRNPRLLSFFIYHLGVDSITILGTPAKTLLLRLALAHLWMKNITPLFRRAVHSKPISALTEQAESEGPRDVNAGCTFSSRISKPAGCSRQPCQRADADWPKVQLRNIVPKPFFGSVAFTSSRVLI